jgi:hypothetical protein
MRPLISILTAICYFNSDNKRRKNEKIIIDETVKSHAARKAKGQEPWGQPKAAGRKNLQRSSLKTENRLFFLDEPDL